MKTMRAPAALVVLATLSLAGCGGEAGAPAQTGAAVPFASAAAQASAAPAAAAVLSDAQVRSFLSELERASRAGNPAAVWELISEDAHGRRSAPVGPINEMDSRSLLLELTTPPPPGRVYAPTQIHSVSVASDGRSATFDTTGGYTETQGNGSVVVATDERTGTIALVGDKPKLVEYIIRDTSFTGNGVKLY